MNDPKHIQHILEENNLGIKLDIGCGGNKQPGFVGIDNRELPGVDVVWDLELFPWPLPSESASLCMASHLLEHIDPHGGDARLTPLIKLLLDKGLVNPEEIERIMGNYDTGPRFLEIMDEIWRILKPDGQFMITVPYATSIGFSQDPTHINQINEVTWAYFDPLEPNTNGQLYRIYEPKPWKIEASAWNAFGNLECLLIKRRDDNSYHRDPKKKDYSKAGVTS